MKVYGICRLCKDIELNHLASGTAYLSNSIACDRRFSKEEKKADFFYIKAFGKTAEAMANFLHKGSKIFIEGDIQVDEYTDKLGNKKSSTYILINSFEFAESKGASDPAEQAKNNDFLSIPEGLVEELPFQ